MFLEIFKGDGFKQLVVIYVFIEGYQLIFDVLKCQLLDGEVNFRSEMDEFLVGFGEVKDIVKDCVGDCLQEILQVIEVKGLEVMNVMIDFQSQVSFVFCL